MIQYPSQVGKFSSALTLLSGEAVDISVLSGDVIQVTHGNERNTFQSEYDLILWLLEQLIDPISSYLQWMKEHKPCPKC